MKALHVTWSLSPEEHRVIRRRRRANRGLPHNWDRQKTRNEPKLSAGKGIDADNVIQSAKAMKDYLDYVQTSPDYDTVIIRSSMEKNDGMAIRYKIK